MILTYQRLVGLQQYLLSTYSFSDGAKKSSLFEVASIGLVFSPKISTRRGTGNFGETKFPGDSPKIPVYTIKLPSFHQKSLTITFKVHNYVL